VNKPNFANSYWDTKPNPWARKL